MGMSEMVKCKNCGHSLVKSEIHGYIHENKHPNKKNLHNWEAFICRVKIGVHWCNCLKPEPLDETSGEKSLGASHKVIT